MAGPSIVVRVLGDLKGLGAAIGDAASKGSSGASKLKAAWGGTLSALNQTGVLGPFQGALDGVGTALEQISEHGKATGAVMMGVGGTMAGVGVALSALGSKEKASHDQLKAAVEATGASYDDYAKRIDAAAKHNERFGYTTHQTDDALRVLTQATGSPAKALQMLGTATDLAAAKHESLDTAATQLGRAYNGAGKIFKEFGITVTKTATVQKAVETATKSATAADTAYGNAKKRLAELEIIDAGKKKLTAAEALRLRDAQDAVQAAAVKSMQAHAKLNAAQDAAKRSANGQQTAIDQLAKKLHGQAAASADTFTGKMKAIGATVEDAAARFGQKFGPALTIAGTALAGLGGAVTGAQGIIGMFSKGQEAATAATEAVTAAEGSEAIASWAALGPLLLIIGAIAALVVAGYVIYRNWKTIWHGIQVAIEFVWDWIKKNWPLLLGILTGPIGLAVLAIIKYRDTIWNAIKAVWQWIRDAWIDIYGWLRKPFDLVVGVIQNAMGSIFGAVANVWRWIRDSWHTIYDWLIWPFRAQIATVQWAMTTVWNAITGVYNWVARSWSGLLNILTWPFNVAKDTIWNGWNALVGFLSGLPGRISSVLGGMWDFIPRAFRGAINSLIDGWNSLHFKIPGFSIGPVHVGGMDIGVPSIPHLAQGGLMTGDGLVFAHAGEVITPAPNSTRTSPAVWIESATFAETLDVDTFMARAAWAVRRERI